MTAGEEEVTQKIACRTPKGPDFGLPTQLVIFSGNPPFVSGMTPMAWRERPGVAGMMGRGPGWFWKASRPWW